MTVEGAPPDLPSPLDEMLCLDGPRDRGYIRRQIEGAGFDIDDIRTHHDDLLAMRNRIRENVEYEQPIDALGDRGSRLRSGARDLESAIESGRSSYVSIVATERS